MVLWCACRYCRLAPLPNSVSKGMLCDQPSAATATEFLYTGNGLSAQGVPLVTQGQGQPLALGGTSPNADPNLTFTPAGASGTC